MLANPRTTKLVRERRRSEIEALLLERVPRRDVVRSMTERHSCSESTVERDMALICARWATQDRADRAHNLAKAVRFAEREIARLRRRIRRLPARDGDPPPAALTPRESTSMSLALLRWEEHLAKLQGLIIGRVEIGLAQDPVTVVFSVPGGPPDAPQIIDVTPDQG